MNKIHEHSIFNTHPQKSIIIEVEWQGPLKTLTREYTRITLQHGGRRLATLDMPRRPDSTSNVYALGLSEPLLTNTDAISNLEVYISFLKYSPRELEYSRAGVMHTPTILDQGTYRLILHAPLINPEASEHRYKLTLKNTTELHSEHVKLHANLSPIAYITINNSPRLESAQPSI